MMNTLISLFFPVLALQHISSIEHMVEAKAFSSYCQSQSNLLCENLHIKFFVLFCGLLLEMFDNMDALYMYLYF